MSNAEATKTNSRRIPAIGLLIGALLLALVAKTLLDAARRSSMPFRERHGLGAILACAFFAALTAVMAAVAAAIGKKLNRIVCVLLATAAGTMASLLYQPVFGAIGGLVIGVIVATGFGRPVAFATIGVFASVAIGSVLGLAAFTSTDLPVDPIILPAVMLAATLTMFASIAVILSIKCRAGFSATQRRRLVGGSLLLLPLTFGVWVGLSIDVLWRVWLIQGNTDLETTPAGLHWLSEGVFAVDGFGMSATAREADLARMKRFRKVTLFADHNKRLTDGGLKYVGEASGLRNLVIDGSPITDEGLVHLRGLNGIWLLHLTETKVTGAGLDDVCPTLSQLSLSGSPVTDDGVRHLQHITSLLWLSLDATQITDAGLEHLWPLTTLRGLGLRRTRISDAGLEALSKIATLIRLDLADTQIGDDGLRHLAQLGGLVHLDLSGTEITDEGLVHLKSLTKLTTLNLEGTATTNAGMQDLKVALPDLHIDPPDSKRANPE